MKVSVGRMKKAVSEMPREDLERLANYVLWSAYARPDDELGSNEERAALDTASHHRCFFDTEAEISGADFVQNVLADLDAVGLNPEKFADDNATEIQP